MENMAIEQQIADLEKQLQDKKAALERPEKEILHDIVGEKIQEHAPEYTPKTYAPVTSTPQVGDPPSYLTQDMKDKIQELINLVFTQSIDAGIKSAAQSGNPALIDAFHDVLVDELYGALLERQKIKKIE